MTLEQRFRKALASGFEYMAVWSDLLDRINVFPVADGDTGKNLVVSLSPLRDQLMPRHELAQQLLLYARGCSGNISARFFDGLLQVRVEEISAGLQQARKQAWKAIADPKHGTILSLYDALVDGLNRASLPSQQEQVDQTLDLLEQAVCSTSEQIPELKSAQVVDAGALAMFLFWDGFFQEWIQRPNGFRLVTERFAHLLKPCDHFEVKKYQGHCVDALIKFSRTPDSLPPWMKDGDSAISYSDSQWTKVHLHTSDCGKLRQQMEQSGEIVDWNADDLEAQTSEFLRPTIESTVHLMTDAAGSITRTDARRLGMTLLDSYILVGHRCVPETHVRPEELYRAMRQGLRVSTSQASNFERDQQYHKALALHSNVLYLCVGSVYTGNYQAASDWKARHDPENRLVVVDSGAASGRLGLMSLMAARKALALATGHPGQLLEYVRRAVSLCQEFVFLDQLKYLAAGGRLSKGSAFFGDLVHLKPIVSPMPDGARKVGALFSRQAQIDFALDKLDATFGQDQNGVVMLQYSDNQEWLNNELLGLVRSRFERLEIMVQPLSLTSGAHMGPGTWAMAFLPTLDG